MTTTFVGVDADTRNVTFVARNGGDLRGPIILRLRGRRAEERLLNLIERAGEAQATVRELAGGDESKAVVYIERPMVGRNIRAALDQMAVVGVLRAVLHPVPTTTVDPGTWKKAVIGNGRAAKETIREWAVRVLGMADSLPQDAYDAAAIASWASRYE